MSLALILTTVNAPYRTRLGADELAHCLQDHEAAKAVPGHMSSFFGEVDPALQVSFATHFGISEPQLAAAAKAFAAYSGESYPLAACAPHQRRGLGPAISGRAFNHSPSKLGSPDRSGLDLRGRDGADASHWASYQSRCRYFPT